MFATRNKQDLSLFRDPIQLFTDRRPSTVQKHRNLRPLLQQLMNRQIKYRWAFPFKLSFTFKGRAHSFSKFQDGKDLLLDLGIITRGSQAPSPQHQAGRPLSPLGQDRKNTQARKSPQNT